MSSQAFSQQTVITGTVKDQAGVTLPGVSVLLKNTTTGTITNESGAFSIKVPNSQAILVFRYLGFDPLERTVGANSTLAVVMLESTNSLTEVIVVGYGEQKKSTLTGAIATVNTKEILKSPTSNVTNSLVGRVTGLTAVQSGGQPGNNAATISIRGAATYGNTAAIVIVDGIERSSFGDIDPNEIESVSVLKDASSTAIFGIKGANGVIIVTTRSGKEGKPKISYSGNTSMQTYTGIPKALSAYDNAFLINEANRNDGRAETWRADELQKFKDGSDPYGYPDVNWFEEVTRKSYLQTQHNVNVSGGTKLIKYFTSVGYLFEDGIFKELDSPYGIRTTPSYTRYNFRSNLDLNLTKNLQVSVRLGGRLGKRYQPSGLGGNAFAYDNVEGMISRILQTPSFAFPITLADGRIAQNPDVGTNIWNPLAVLTRWGTRNDDANTIESNFNVNYKLDGITKGLSFKGIFGYDSYFTSNMRRNANWAAYIQDRTTGVVTLDPGARNINEPLGGFISTSSGNISSNLQLGFNYARSFGKHNFSGVLLATRQLNQQEGTGLNAAPRAVEGIVSRSTYNFNEKYFVEFNAAYNGSEAFAPGYQYGFFPAVSGGWNISRENFLKDVTWIDNLKIRGSYGQVGNDGLTNANRFLFLSDYNVQNGGAVFGLPNSSVSSPIVVVTGNSEGNQLVTWETGTKRNIGFESRFFKNSLEFIVDLFDETRSGILTQKNSGQVIYGLTYPALNIGEVYNKGYEAELNYRNRVGAFNYSLNTQISFARNKIISRDEPISTPANKLQAGNRVGQFYGLTSLGFYTSQADIDAYLPTTIPGVRIPGDLKYKDIDGDGVITVDDTSPIGFSRTPEYTYSVAPTLSWKGISLSVLFQGVANVSSDYILAENNNGAQMYEFQLERWTPETAATATWPALHSRTVSSGNYRLNDFTLQNAAYLKVRNAELAWNLPQKWVKSLKLNSLRVALSGQNLYTWTKFKFYVDPENVNTSFTNFSRQSVYPTSRIYNLGLNVTL
ncbi:SusC/RagA family TonB-linked outer membrane protein [Pedobacter cryophilus]|nr:TonB-dependent receptor [Pedobacter cryophilus]